MINKGSSFTDLVRFRPYTYPALNNLCRPYGRQLASKIFILNLDKSDAKNIVNCNRRNSVENSETVLILCYLNTSRQEKNSKLRTNSCLIK